MKNSDRKLLKPQAELPANWEAEITALKSVSLDAFFCAHYSASGPRGHRRDLPFWSCRRCAQQIELHLDLGFRVLGHDGKRIPRRALVPRRAA